MEPDRVADSEVIADALREALDTVLAQDTEGLSDLVGHRVVASKHELVGLVQAVTSRLEPAIAAEAARILADGKSHLSAQPRRWGVSRNYARQLSRWMDVSTSTPPRDVEGLLAWAALRDAAATLPPDNRAPVMLAVSGGLSVNAIASELGITTDEVKVRLREGIAQLRKAITPADRPVDTKGRDDRTEGFRMMLARSSIIERLADSDGPTAMDELVAAFGSASKRDRALLEALVGTPTGVDFEELASVALSEGQREQRHSPGRVTEALIRLQEQLPSRWKIEEISGLLILDYWPDPMTGLAGRPSFTMHFDSISDNLGGSALQPSRTAAAAFLSSFADGSLHEEIHALSVDDPDLSI